MMDFYLNQTERTCFLRAEHFSGGDRYLERFYPGTGPATLSTVQWAELFMQATAQAKEQSWSRLIFRFTQGHETKELCRHLSLLGYSKINARVEFRREISALPDEQGSPFVWQILSLEESAEVMEKAALEDPDYDPRYDVAYDCLQGYLQDPVLNCTADCVQVGFLNGQAAAIVVAQVNPRSKWSRITYMGLIPQFRGQGLGKWVHRHGFAMMKAQQGEIYQGGTVEKNLRMQALFRLHGLEEFRRMEEWAWFL